MPVFSTKCDIAVAMAHVESPKESWDRRFRFHEVIAKVRQLSKVQFYLGHSVDDNT